MTADERNAIERFPVVAEEYCRLIDGCDKPARKQLLQKVAVHLARLYEVATLLPEIELATEGVERGVESTPEAVATHTEEWTKLANNLRQILGPLDGYWEIFDPTQKEEAVFCSLSNDIAEIYLDLKDALKLLESGVAPNDIQWQWRFDFRSHWGKHTVNALTAIHHVAAWDYE